jgi:tRNA(Ile)-lysidine synthase
MLSAYNIPEDLLYNIISHYGFNHDQSGDIIDSLENTGNTFESQAYKLVNDREKLFIQSKAELQPLHIEIHGSGTFKTEYGIVVIKETENLKKINFNSNVKYLNGDKLIFPVILRTRKPGDIFSPFGLKGKTQKIKKFINNKKVPVPDKKKILVLESEGIIHLIAGIEISYNMRVTDDCSKVFSVEIK